MQHLVDSYGRTINYLRLSVTDRCNLRCTYCMPEQGLTFAKKDELLSYEELLDLADVLGAVGINKIRITGGEPFVRADLIHFLEELTKKSFLENISITSNLTLIKPHLDQLERIGIKDVNVSLDCLDREKFHAITRRDNFHEVEEALYEMIDRKFNVKLNCVVMAGINEDQVIPLLGLAKSNPISVRFLEEMPFNGSGEALEKTINYRQILKIIDEHVDYTKLIDAPNSTSQNYSVEGYQGTFGIIPSFSRTFCGSCNRLRLSATGEVRTCLYGSNQLNIKEHIRNGATDDQLKYELLHAVANKPKDGFEAAEANEQNYESMTKLGG